MDDKEKELIKKLSSVVDRLARKVGASEAAGFIQEVSDCVVDLAVNRIPATGSEIRLMAGEMSEDEMRTMQAVLGGVGVKIAGLHMLTYKIALDSTKPVQITRSEDAKALVFGDLVFDSRIGPVSCSVRAEDGYAPDLTIDFKQVTFDDLDRHPCEDGVFINSVNLYLKNAGYKGPKIDRAELGMQSKSRVVLEGGRQFKEWLTTLGWKDLDVRAKPKI